MTAQAVNEAPLRRSCLSVPGASAKMLAKARGVPADEAMLDLEDSVAPDAKNDATREQVVRALLEDDWQAGILAVRVNGVGTPWCLRDVEYVVAEAGARIDSVIVPKVEDESHVHFVEHLLASLEAANRLSRKIGIEVQIESARGLVNVDRIASASPRLETLVFGPGDYAASIGMPHLSLGAIDAEYAGDLWHYPLSRIVSTARAYGLQAIDGPFAAIRDLDGFEESARCAQRLGYDGKWVLHPDQVARCNAVFTPDQAQYDAAEALLDAYDRAVEMEGRGAALHGGEMIDEASRKMARSVAARGRAAGLVRSTEHDEHESEALTRGGAQC